jgi:5-methylcytosine-specific restriction endonuclease McrA
VAPRMAATAGNVPSALDRRTLVLNRGWTPVHVTSVRRALVLMFHRAALAIRPDTYETFEFPAWMARKPAPTEYLVRTVSAAIPAPEVILLSTYDRMHRFQAPFTRKNLCRRDGLRCQYCGRRPTLEELTIDHVVPRAQGGATGWANCVLACASCNRRKGGRTPEEAGMSLIAKPARPEWTTALALDPGGHHDGVFHLARKLAGNVRAIGAV